ncbi:hypothetical protein PPERSA_09402 [Pseudocohnilembus persalinus]|uniref:Tubulin-tyrosine ligase/Tubulin polyglutamylase n=1 Tax=Pseudocohnilembus persalinus TaxID=266149 RepID=A0A0V0R509_PSEPJ|nr:hypothetical protein PPERSA_09402 [Pseudocohnilembus persalinus]|eukprot:KRX09572.1 hypothetical protein PPERSA_09402 [Pseudocohnilembus persalinus]
MKHYLMLWCFFILLFLIGPAKFQKIQLDKNINCLQNNISRDLYNISQFQSKEFNEGKIEQQTKESAQDIENQTECIDHENILEQQSVNENLKITKFIRKRQQDLLRNPYDYDGKTLLDLNCDKLKQKKKVVIRAQSTLVHNYFKSRCDYEIYREKDYKITTDFYLKYTQIFIQILIRLTKATQSVRGIGIQIYKGLQKIQEYVKSQKSKAKNSNEKKSQKTLFVQKYMENPLLKDKKKLDLRVFALIVNLDPLVLLYQDGYIKQCYLPYEPNINENDENWAFKHITNVQFQDKYYYSDQNKVAEHCLSQPEFEKFLREEKNLGDKELSALNEEAKKIIAYSIMSAKDKMVSKQGTFQFIGADLIFDENLNMKLIEFNCNPGLKSDFNCQKYVMPQLIPTMLDLVLETQADFSTFREKWANPEKLELGRWQIVINEVADYNILDDYLLDKNNLEKEKKYKQFVDM